MKQLQKLDKRLITILLQLGRNNPAVLDFPNLSFFGNFESLASKHQIRSFSRNDKLMGYLCPRVLLIVGMEMVGSSIMIPILHFTPTRIWVRWAHDFDLDFGLLCGTICGAAMGGNQDPISTDVFRSWLSANPSTSSGQDRHGHRLYYDRLRPFAARILDGVTGGNIIVAQAYFI